MSTKKFPSRFAIVLRVLFLTVLTASAVALTASAATGGRFALIDQVSEFLGLQPTQNKIFKEQPQPAPVSGVATEAVTNVVESPLPSLTLPDATTKTIDFAGYTGTGFQATPTAGQLDSDDWAVTGWSDGALAFGATRTTGDYARGAVSTAQTTGGFYAYTGAPGSAANPAFMIQPGTSDFAPGTMTLRLQNTGSTAITQLSLSYDIFVRNDQDRSSSFNFSHSADNSTYTTVGALDYSSTAPLDALGWNRVGTAPSRSTTITGINVAPSGFYYIRWSSADVGGSGSRDEFGLDNISVTPTFAPPTFTVTYNGNGNTGGTVPVDGSSPYTSGATVTVLGNTGSLVKTGSTFAGWNTAADGSGTNYNPSDTFTILANTTLYARWTLNTYTINASAGTHGSISPSGAVSVNHGANQLFTITPDGGYNVQDVLVDGVSQGAIPSFTFNNVTTGHTISASFVSSNPPTHLTITNISPSSPIAGSGFDVTVQAQDASNLPGNVTLATGFSLTKTAGSGGGTIGGTLTGTIGAGSSSVTVTGATLSTSGTGIQLTATQTSGDSLTPGTSASFNVLPSAAGASKLVITNISPASPFAGVGFDVTVQSQNSSSAATNVVDATSFSLSNTGGGTIGGTTTGTITATTNQVVVTGVTLSSAGTGITLTATRTAGENLTAGTSAGFTVQSTPTKLAITNISPASPVAGSTFDVTVQSQDGSSVAASVQANTGFTLSTNGNAGSIGGTTTGTITAGTNQVIVTGVTLPTPGTGVTLTATRTSGDNLTAGTSATFIVLGVADHIVFAGVPATGTVGTNLATFTVEARRADNTLDTNYTGNATISKASGPGTLSGTLTKPSVGGIATFNDIQLSAAGSYALFGDSSTFLQITSTTITVSDVSLATDYFRSAATGNWGSTGTWESSHDNSTWSSATLTPTNNANTVSIRNVHTVAVAASVTVDQVVIESGGILSHTTGTLTVANGAGDDIDVQNGGVFNLAVATQTYSGSVANIATGGLLRVSASGLTGVGAGVNSANYVYKNASILEYAISSSFSSSGVTYFPNVDANTIPIFRATSSMTVGAGTQTTFNGIFEVGSGATITWSGTATKTFRNGIRGAGNVTQSTAGQFIINGAIAELGGSGTLTLGAAGMVINSATTASLSSNKTINTNTTTVNGTLNCGTNILSGSTNFTLASGGTLGMGDPGGISSSGATGNIQVTGTRSFNAGATYVYNGTAAQSTGNGLPAAVSGLTINNTAGVTLGGSQTVNTTLSLTAGALSTGANMVIMATGSTVSRTGGHVIGNLQKTFTANAAQTFEVGTANGYSPVAVNATAGTYPANFTVKATEGKAPYVSGTNALARYWTLTSPGSITADLTFNYLPTDVTGNFASYQFIKNSSGTLTTLAPTGTPTDTTATINGVSSFSDWTLAESSAVLPGSFNFSAANYDTSETDADHLVTITVQRASGSDGAVSVHYATSDGSALLADSDYASASGDLSWTAGDTTDKTFTVTVKGDNTFEPDETVNLTLSAPTGGATLGSPNPGAITILNDDVVYTITASKTGNGTISPTGAVSVNEGDNQTFTITPDANNHLASLVVDGSTVANTNSYTFTNVTATHTIVANFALDQYQVIYNGNGNTGGTAPATQTADFGSSVILAGAGTLVKEGHTFNGWNTAANGSGTGYAVGASFTIPASNTTLYAQWTINQYTVTYDANGGTGSQNDTNSPYNFGSTVTVLGTGSITRAGYTFAHWNTAADDSGTSYNPADTFTLGAANVVLYAQWTAAPPTISNPGTLLAFSTTYGTASAAQTQSVTGSNLTADITATAPAGYEVSNGGAYGASTTFTQSGGSASGTLSIRLAALTAPSAALGTILSYTSAGATTQNVTVSGTVNKYTPLVTATGTTSFTYNGSPQGPDTSTVTGVSGGIAPSGAVTYSYAGTGGTTYGPSATKPTDAGTYSVTASSAMDANYNAASSSPLAFTIAAATQATLTVDDPGTVTYGSTPQLTTTGGSGTGAVTFDNGGSAGCSVTSGGVLTVTDASAACNVTATKAADNNYNSTTSASRAITPAKANQAALTAVATPSTVVYGNTSALSTTGGTTAGAVTFSFGLSTGCSVSVATLSVTDASGTCAVTATMAGDNNYNDVTSAPLTVTLQKATQTITFGALADKTYGDPDFMVSATGGGSPNPVTFAASGNCTVTGAMVHLTGAGSCTITASQAGNNNYLAATDVPQTFNIGAATPVITVMGGPLTFADTPVGGIAAEQSYTVQAANLTADLVVTSPSTDFEVSTTSGSGFGSSVSLVPSGGTVVATTIVLRFVPGSTGLKGGNITNASAGAVTKNVAVSGTGAAGAYFRTNQTGLWEDASVWEISADGVSGWVDSTFTPTAANSDGIVIRSPDIVSVVASSETADQFDINTGGRVNVGGTLTITDGAGTDAAVNGILSVAGGLELGGTLTNSGTVTILGGYRQLEGGAATGTAFAYGLGTVLEYAGTTAQTTTSVEYPLIGTTPSNLYINNPGGVVLHSNRNVAGLFWLQNGTLKTDATKLLTVTNTAANAVMGGSSTSYVKGPLARRMPASLTGSNTYAFPVGKGGYNGFELIDPQTTAAAPTMQVEVFDAHPGGFGASGIENLRDKYWSAEVPVGGFVDTQVRLIDSGLTNGVDQVGFNGDLTPAGNYLAKGGFVMGNSIFSTATSNPPGFYAIGSPAPIIAADPFPLDFGSQIILTQSSQQDLTVTNTGSSDLSISAASITGAHQGDFAVTSGPASYPVVLAPGASTVYGIKFTPSALGARNAALRLTSDAQNGATFDAELTGNGAAVPTYTINATSGANGAVTPAGATTVTAGGSQTYTITPDAGYHIVDVLVDGSSVGAVGSYTFMAVIANHTISATFALNTYTITASAGANGSISPSGAVVVNHGASQSFTITPNANYHILDVVVDGSSVGTGGSYTFTSVTANHTITATFAINTYTITASAGANGSISPSGAVIVNHGANQSFTITPNASYHILDVLVDGVSAGTGGSYTFTSVTANHTIAASFAIDTFTLTYDANGGTGVQSDPDSPYNAGSTVTILGAGGISRTGYTFTGWNTMPDGTGTSFSPGNTFTIFGNTTLYAQWTINQYSVSYNGNGNTGGTAPATQTADYNTSITLAGAGSLVKTGYTFSGWNTAANGSGTGYSAGASFTIPASNTTLYAQRTINTYTITATAGAGGSISPSGAVSVNHGANQSFTITADAGYHIVDVVADSVSQGATGSYTFTNVTANHTISASFAIDAYTITASAGANGSISPSGAVSVNHGANQSFTITPDGGYNVADVLVDGVSAGAVTSYTFTNVTANHTISATFFLGAQAAIVYVDDNWVGTPLGTDPDGAGPATSFGYDAFATIQGGVAGVATGGTVIVNPGSYTGDITVNRVMDVRGIFTLAGDLNVTAAGASVSPGTSPGIINTGDLSLTAGSNLNIEINGPTVGAQYDQVNVTGTVSLGNANLNVALSNLYNPSAGQAFTIVNNDSTDAVTGTFGGLAQGDVFYSGATSFQISYTGGTGNDVVLTVVALCNSVSIPSSSTLTANPVVVPVNVDNTTGKALQSTDFTINYNPSVLAFSSASLGTVTAGSVLNTNSSTPGTLVVSIFNATPFTGAGSMLNITFNAVGLPGTSSAVAFSAFKFNEGTQCISTSGGSVSVISGNITGTVTYGNSIPTATRHVPNTVIDAAGSVNASTSTDLAGAYSISNLGSGSYTVTPSRTGGVNGAVSGFDAGQIAMWVVGSTTLNSTQQTVADVSGTGGVSSFDAALIARYAASLPNAGSSGTWRFSPSSTTYPNVNVNRAGDYTALLMGDVSGNWIDPLATRPAQLTMEEIPIEIGVPTLSAAVNTEVTVPVEIGDTTGKGIISYQFNMRYDPAILAPAASPADLANTISAGYSLTVNAQQPGVLRVVVFGAQPLTGAGHLVNLRFNTIGTAGSASHLVWEDLLLNEGGFDIQTTNGLVQVTAPATSASISGRVLSAEGQPIFRAKVTVTDTTGVSRVYTTSQLGFYTFEGLRIGETYTIKTSAKRYRFTTLTVSATGGLTSLDIIANPGG